MTAAQREAEGGKGRVRREQVRGGVAQIARALIRRRGRVVRAQPAVQLRVLDRAACIDVEAVEERIDLGETHVAVELQ